MFQNTSISPNTLIHYKRSIGVFFSGDNKVPSSERCLFGSSFIAFFCKCHFEKNQENSLALQKIITTDMHLSCVAAVMEEQQHVRRASQSILQQRNVVMAARSSSLHTAGTGPFASFQKLRRLGVEVNLKVNCNKYLHSLYSRSLLAWMYCIFPLEQLSAYHTRALKTSSLSSPNCCCFRKIHPGRKTAMYFEHIIFFCNHTPFQLHCLKHRHCYKHLLVA